MIADAIELTTLSASQILYWAPNGTTPGGTNTWDPGSSTDYYWLPAGGGSALAWPNSSSSPAVAIFAGSGGTVTLQSTPYFTEMVFAAASYTLDGTLASSAGLVTVAGTSLALGAADTVSALAITGGVLDLGTNTATVNGTASLSAGTVKDGTLAADAFFGQQATVSAVLEDNGSNSAPLTVGSDGAGNPLVLTAQNTFSDGTTINQGAALQLGDGTSGNDGSILGGVDDNGNLHLQHLRLVAPVHLRQHGIGHGQPYDNWARNRRVAERQLLHRDDGRCIGRPEYPERRGTGQHGGGRLRAERRHAPNSGRNQRRHDGKSQSRWARVGLPRALDSVSGNNTWSGPIRIGDFAGDATQINSDSNTLTLPGGIDSFFGPASCPLGFGGAGNISLPVGGVGIGAGVGDVTEAGSGTVTFAVADFYLDTTYVSSGTMIVRTPAGILDGSNLVVGGDPSLFTSIDPGDYTGRFGDGDSDGGGSAPAPVLDNGMTEAHELVAAGSDALNAIAAVVFPGQTLATLSVDETLQVCNDCTTICLGAVAIANNSGTGLTTAAINASIGQWLKAQGMSATPNGATITSPYNNPWNNSGIALFVAISQFFATNDIS